MADGGDEMHLVRDVLDKQLVDHAGHDPMGMADGIVIEVRDVNQPPRVIAIESGFPVLARRVSPKLEPIVRWLGRRLGVRRGIVYRIHYFPSLSKRKPRSFVPRIGVVKVAASRVFPPSRFVNIPD